MVSQLRANLHDKAAASSHPGRHSKSPEPTTASGVRLDHALYDTPPPGADAPEVVLGPRSCRSTEHGENQNEIICKRNIRSEQWLRTNKINNAMRAASQEGPGVDSVSRTGRGRSTNICALGQSQPRASKSEAPPKRKPSRSHSQSQSRPRVRVCTTNVKADEAKQRERQCQDLKRIARSPTPGSSDIEPGELNSSKYTYIWGNARYKTLEDYVEARLGESVTGWTEDQIIAKLDILENYQAPAMANPGINSSVVVLPPTPIAVGGGWHREHEPRPVANKANGQATVKRICLADPNNTDTEPESDDDLIPASSGPPPPPAPPAPPAVRAENPRPPIATLTHVSTATTTLETPLEGQTTESPSLGSPSVSRFPPLPQLLPPMNLPRGPVHARLQARVAMQELVQDLMQEDSGEDEGVRMDGPVPSQQEAQQEGTPITYAGYRSHLDSPDDTNDEPPTAPPPTRVNTPAPSKKQSRHPANSVLWHLERAQAVDAVRDLIRAGRAKAVSRSRIRPQHAEPSAPPKTSVQQPSSSRSGKKLSRRLDPVGAAQADLVEFNKQCAHDGVRNFVQGVTRQNERTRHYTLHEGEVRSPTDLLADNEEDRAHDEALREGKQPAGGRKKKPQARDFSGIRGHILTLAKLHLFAFALSEGIYQTRATLMMWAALVHEATWLMELPNVPYVAATTEELEVMVNYIATLRGKIKERVRPVLSHVEGFDHCVATQEDIQTNLDLFYELYPNSFHCTSRRPRKGHYENVLLARCIAAAFFYGPNSVGVLFPDYFEDMPLTIIAFILAIIQFCLEEWSDGYFVSRDLGAGNMLDKYEAHLKARQVANRFLAEYVLNTRHFYCTQGTRL